MSDAGDNIPKYKMVDGQLVELTPGEIAEIEKERHDALLRPAPGEAAQQEPEHASSRTKRR